MALSREEIANRYGSALFGYAQDMRALETVYDDLQELKKAVQANPRILTILSDPILNGMKRRNLCR